ncbi:MAG: cyclodeaminase/cyclohydrolase family protein [Coriobacteriales bacterium]|nr:cyclodeaminase/cyclohydrolase family protein [Coriobacteriales bacterium]
MENFIEYSCDEFVEVLASKSPVPGGGGASALVGALGVALGNMVGSLTVGKPRFADVEADIIALKARSDTLQSELLGLIERDAEAFEPLSRAYGLPVGTETERAHKTKIMEKCLRKACAAPLEIMEKCCEAIDLHEDFAAKGTPLALSDVGVGVKFAQAALQGASLNVFINTKAMTDRLYAKKIEKKAHALLENYVRKADFIFESVAGRFTGEDTV